MCVEGYEPAFHLTTGALIRCVKRGLKCNIPAATIDITGTRCACQDGFKPEFGSAGELLNCTTAGTAPSNGAKPDNAAAVSGAWTLIDVLANDARPQLRIAAVSQPEGGGRTVLSPGANGDKDSVRYISRSGFTGTAVFNYTTPDGTATVTVNVLPGSCLNNRCGVAGSCQGGKCSCAADSGMVPTFIRNLDAAARAVTPRVPACRYPGESSA
jgi:hypothetical protein